MIRAAAAAAVAAIGDAGASGPTPTFVIHEIGYCGTSTSRGRFSTRNGKFNCRQSPMLRPLRAASEREAGAQREAAARHRAESIVRQETRG